VFTTGGPRLGEFASGVVAQVWGAEMSALTGGLATLALVAGIALIPSARRFRLDLPATQAERERRSEPAGRR